MVDSLIERQFVDSIDAARRSYLDVLIDLNLAEPHRSPLGHQAFLEAIDLRFKMLLTKAFVEVVESDLYLSPAEAELAQLLLRHLHQRSVWRSRVAAEFDQLSHDAKRHPWEFILEPLHWYPKTCEFQQELETSVLRMANIIAKVDGGVAGEAISQLRMLKMQLDQHLPACQPNRVATDAVTPTGTEEIGEL
ncbi:MAG: hypothetical protein AAGJ83_12495, partial [Planctomycetota bacterium]